MSRPTRVEVTRGIQKRRQASGLGVGCAEAQADGVPCPELSRDCGNCDKAASAVSATGRPAGHRASQRASQKS